MKNNKNHKMHQEIEYDLCVIGGGIAGLNALYAASRYLDKNDKVLLIDKNSGPGGMWLNTYDFVKLHQPYQFFTCGNLKWKLKKPSSHLATKTEVLDHLNDCYAKVKRSVNLTEHWNHTYLNSEEIDEGGCFRAHVSFLNNETKEKVNIKAKKVIEAFGSNIVSSLPLVFSSSKERSLSPESPELFEKEIELSNKPIYIIGGGKTAMDMAHQLLQRFPQKEIHMIVGKGMLFLNRSKFFPTGVKKYFGGALFPSVYIGLSMRFNGTNIAASRKYLKDRGLSMVEDPKHCMLGMLSPEELDFVSKGIREVHNDYLEDVIDTGKSSALKMKSGKIINIEQGSWFINCTGYVFRNEEQEYKPFLSKQSTILTFSPNYLIFSLSSYTSYYLTHLWFLEKLRTTPLYVIDNLGLMRKDKEVGIFALLSISTYNLLVITRVLPFKLLKECDLGFNNWYPKYRQFFSLLKLIMKRRKCIQHTKNVLDVLQKRLNIKCGPME